MITKNQVREYIKGKELMVSKDYFDTLEEELKSLIDKSCARCTANSRKTLSSKDL